jgi:hypothetical protein
MGEVEGDGDAAVAEAAAKAASKIAVRVMLYLPVREGKQGPASKK